MSLKKINTLLSAAFTRKVAAAPATPSPQPA